MVESKGCMSLSVHDAHCHSSTTYQLSPGLQDKQIQTEVLSLLDVPMVANEWCLSPTQASPSGHMPYDAAELPLAMSVVHLHPLTLIPANSTSALEQLCIFNDACKQH